MSASVVEIPSELVPQFYEMDPETEDLLFDGTLLQPGMVVLIEAPELRMPLEFADAAPLAPEQMDVAKLNNRWTKIVIAEIHSGDVSFIGEFADGTRRKRSTPVRYAWLVKRNSLPDMFPA